MIVEFTYTEIDDPEATCTGLTQKDVVNMIGEHNEYFGTNYQTIREFNESEPHRKIIVVIRQ